MGLPVSNDSNEAISSDFDSKLSAILSNHIVRFSKLNPAQFFLAKSAALTACSTSLELDLGMCAIISPVAGFMSSIVFSVSANLPLM